MSSARRVDPNTTLLFTRRTTQRLFLLRPDATVNQVFLYCLGCAAEKHSVRLHGLCVMSNHYHLVATDERANAPEFMHWLNSNIARALNFHLGRSENFWVPGTYSRVELLDGDAVLDKLAYTLANPVTAGLVARGEEWPGVRFAPDGDGPLKLVVERPAFFFRKEENDGNLPKEVEVVFEKPPAFAHLDDKEFGAELEEAVECREEKVREEFRSEGRKFLGRKGVLAERPDGSPRSQEPRRKLNPQVASKDKSRRVEMLRRIGRFLEDYRKALQEWRRGVRDVVFPAGTYWMRVHHGVACHPAPG